MAPLENKLHKSQPQGDENIPEFEKLVVPSADSWTFKWSPFFFTATLIYSFMGFYGAYVYFSSAKLLTIVFVQLMVPSSMLGVSAGAHRLWSHRSFKAKPQLEVLLAYLHTMANQGTVVDWCKRHRLHHHCSDTDADPHNATRGFFFSHFYWLLVEPHPEAAKREKYIDVSDLVNNPILRFQQNYFVLLVLLIGHAIPTYIPTLWGESLYVSFYSNIFRMNIVLHLINSINSVAHLVGYRPIDKTVPGTQYQALGTVTSGEGFHNYHHAFPYDYRASEIGDIKYNMSAFFINFMEKIGWAYDLKVTSDDVIKARVLRKGDGTDMYFIPNNEGKQKFFCTELYKQTVNTK